MAKNQKVIFLGDSSVGKTTIINKYFYKTTVDDYQPTVGIDFFAKTVDGIRLQIWDTAGQEKFNSLLPAYLRDATICILVYDITNQESFEKLSVWIKLVTELSDPRFIVVGNKKDLDSARVVTEEQGKEFAHAQKAVFIETSAKNGENIEELFNILYNDYAKYAIDSKTVNSTKSASNNEVQPKTESSPVDISKPSDSAQSYGCGC